MRKANCQWLSRRDLLIIASIFVVITYFMYRGILPGVEFHPSQTGLTLSGPEKTSVELRYDEVFSAELAENPDYGANIGGGVRGSFHYGTWENEEWGTYEAFVSEKIPCCIVLRTENATIAFNFESQDTTERLYPQLQERFGD